MKFEVQVVEAAGANVLRRTYASDCLLYGRHATLPIYDADPERTCDRECVEEARSAGHTYGEVHTQAALERFLRAADDGGLPCDEDLVYVP